MICRELCIEIMYIELKTPMQNIKVMAKANEPTYSAVKANPATARPNNTAPPMIARPRLGMLPRALPRRGAWGGVWADKIKQLVSGLWR